MMQVTLSLHLRRPISLCLLGHDRDDNRESERAIIEPEAMARNGRKKASDPSIHTQSFARSSGK